MMALQIHCSYTCYKHLCPPVGQAAGRAPLPQQSDGVTLLWWQRLSDPWAGILTHRASFLATFFSCMLPPQALVSQRKMGMKAFHRQMEKKCHELLLTQGLWEITPS